nr:MAG TPA: dimeris T4 recombination endonuclease VII [Caudoviricetes sp.]
MAFVIAVRNKHYIKVSKSAYDSIFKKKGYRLVNETKEEKAEEFTNDYTEEVEQEVAETEIPVSEMNKEQLMKYAEEHGIDTSSAKNVGEARKIIQKAIREQHS